MEIEKLLDKLRQSSDFRKYARQNPKAYFCSAFFVIDCKGNKSEAQIDFYSPEKKLITNFSVGKKISIVPEVKKPVNIKKEKFTPKEIKGKVNLKIELIKDILLDEMHNRGMTDEIEKMIITLQNSDDGAIWNCTCFLNGLSLLNAHLEDKTKSVLYLDKKSFFDMIIPVKKGEDINKVLKEMEKKSVDPEKTEGKHQGFIG